MSFNLDKKDLEILNQEKKMGYIISVLLFSIICIINFGIYLSNENYSINYFLIIQLIIFILSCILLYILNKRVYNDLYYGRKIIQKQILENKESNMISNAAYGYRLEIDYFFIVNNTKYRVEKELFDQVEPNQEICFHICEISKYMLRVDIEEYYND